MLPFDLPSSEPLRVLGLGAHADDLEIGCGGTLMQLCASRPVEMCWVVFSGNEERAAEARRSAELFAGEASQLTVETFEFRESFFPDQWAAIKERLHAVASSFAPDLVFTHHLEDRHQDHKVLADLTWNACRDHVVLEYEIPKFEGDLGNPNLFVPLSEETAQAKVERILEAFPTQASKPWFDAETFQALLRLRGLESGSASRYAEAFHARKLCLQS